MREKAGKGEMELERRKERFRINIFQLISNQGQDRRDWKTCSKEMNGDAFFSHAMKGITTSLYARAHNRSLPGGRLCTQACDA